MDSDDLRDELDDLKIRVKTLEQKINVFPEIEERFNNGLSINDPEYFIIKVVKNNSGSKIGKIYQETLKFQADYCRAKFDFVIDLAVKQGLIARMGSNLY